MHRRALGRTGQVVVASAPGTLTRGAETPEEDDRITRAW